MDVLIKDFFGINLLKYLLEVVLVLIEVKMIKLFDI